VTRGAGRMTPGFRRHEIAITILAHEAAHGFFHRALKIL